MIESLFTMLGELPPLARVVIVGAVAVGAYLATLEIGIVGIACGLVAFTYLRITGWPLGLVMVGTAVAVLAGAVVHALLRPRAVCMKCHGEPRQPGIGGFWRNCWLCGGSGQRRRLAAKVLSRHRSHG